MSNPESADSPSCPVCGKVANGDSACANCGWTHGPCIPGNDPRYLVMYSLVQRAVGASTHMKGDSWNVFLRIRPGAREYNMLDVGDHILTDDVSWRISEKEFGVFWMAGSEISWSPGGGLHFKNPVAESEPEWVRDMRRKFANE